MSREKDIFEPAESDMPDDMNTDSKSAAHEPNSKVTAHDTKRNADHPPELSPAHEPGIDPSEDDVDHVDIYAEPAELYEDADDDAILDADEEITEETVEEAIEEAIEEVEADIEEEAE